MWTIKDEIKVRIKVSNKLLTEEEQTSEFAYYLKGKIKAYEAVLEMMKEGQDEK